ncbi:MAG: VanZ family protein [Dehalococcoidia bacterium]
MAATVGWNDVVARVARGCDGEATMRHALLIPALAWAGVIFGLSSMSSPPAPKTFDAFSALAHVFVYAVLAFLLMLWARRAFPGRSAALLMSAVWAVAILYGVSDEWHQSFVPGRHATALDVGFDAVGAALGLAGWPALEAIRPLRSLSPR